MPLNQQTDRFSSLRMKLNKKSRAKIFDLHLGLTFDWRETGILRWRILLWMLFFGVCLSAAAVFVDVDVPGVRRRANQTAAVILFPADNPRLHQYVLRNTPLPVRGPVWADPVTAGPIGETGVTLPSLSSSDTPLEFLPPVPLPTVADQVWRMWKYPDFHILSMMNPSLDVSGTCVPYLSFYSPGLDGRIVTSGALDGFARSEDHTGLRSEFFVVVDEWGVPSQVLLLDSSGSSGADDSAMRFVRSLRWVPSAEPRSGTMSIEWKEAEES